MQGWVSYSIPLSAHSRGEKGSRQPDFRQFKKKEMEGCAQLAGGKNDDSSALHRRDFNKGSKNDEVHFRRWIILGDCKVSGNAHGREL